MCISTKGWYHHKGTVMVGYKCVQLGCVGFSEAFDCIQPIIVLNKMKGYESLF